MRHATRGKTLRLSGHLAASCGALTASLGTALAVIRVLRIALFRAPVANVRAQLANLLSEWAVAGDGIGAQATDRRALNAAGRTGIDAFLADHVRKTVTALGGAKVAGGDAVLSVLIQMMTHIETPYG